MFEARYFVCADAAIVFAFDQSVCHSEHEIIRFLDDFWWNAKLGLIIIPSKRASY